MKSGQRLYLRCRGDSGRSDLDAAQTELLIDKVMEMLYLTDDVDEFALKVLMNYDGKEFKNISSDNLGLENGGRKETGGAKRRGK